MSQKNETERDSARVPGSLKPAFVTRFPDALAYVGVTIASVVVLIATMRLWHLDLRIPINYQIQGDLYLFSSLVKGTLENGWFLHNPSLGAPGGMYYQDFPQLEIVMFAVMKVIGFFTRDWGATLNLYYLLSYPLSAITALFTLRKLGVSRWSAMAAALLFAFLPFHFSRATSHLALSTYYLVPLILLVALWMYDKRIPFFPNAKSGPGRGFSLRDKRTWAAICIAILAGLYSVYYAFFACFFVGVAAVGGWLRTKEWNRLVAGALVIIVIVSAVVVAATPTFAYRAQYGKNSAALDRAPYEAELFGLKITQMLLPMSGHRVPVLAKFRERYNHLEFAKGVNNENDTAALGLVGSVGFLLLLAMLFGARFVPPDETVAGRNLLAASQLSLAGALLATVGGFGAILAFSGFPEIRGYNRISVYIAFLGLTAVAVVLDSVRKRLADKPWGRTAGIVLVVVVAGVGLLDTTTPAMVPSYISGRAAWNSDQAFVDRIEAAMPDGAMILQLPYTEFPEPEYGADKVGFGHVRGYLHSTSLRWSYGAVIGRETAEQIEKLSASKSLVADARRAGYAGLWIDRKVYAGSGAMPTEAELAAQLGEPIVSDDGKLALYSLR